MTMSSQGFIASTPLLTHLSIRSATCTRSTLCARKVTMKADDKPKNPLAGLGGREDKFRHCRLFE